jgi:hypothetical protein
MRIIRRIDEQPAKVASLGTVGHIRIGEKVKNQSGKEYPTSLDYFKPDAPEQYLQYFRSAFGDKPAKITITFLSNDMNDVCRQFYELRDGAGGRMAYGDGVTFYVATKQGDGTVKDVVTVPPDVDKWMKAMETTAGKPWRERLVLKFAIPQIPVLGLWEFSTHANASTIPNIIGTIDTVFQIAGRLAGIPFDLIIEKVKSDKAGSKSVYPVVTMVCNISQESAALVRELPIQAGKMLTEQRIAQLASGEVEQPKESEPFTEYEEVTPDHDDIEDVKDNVEKCLSIAALSILFESDERYKKEPYKALFSAQRKEIERLIKAGQIPGA